MENSWAAFALYMFFSILLFAFTLGGPIAALLGLDDVASGIYNAGKPFCHQWIYRSYCIFNATNGWIVEDCIPADYNGTAIVHTKYTLASHAWDGVFAYSIAQVGRNRAEVVERDGMTGYKFVVCSRDSAMYFGMVFAGFAFLYLRRRIKETPSLLFLILGMIPMGIDGTGQLFGLWESTNMMRAITGFIAGAVIGFYLLSLLTEIMVKVDRRKGLDARRPAK